MAFSVRIGGSGLLYQAPQNISLPAGAIYIIPSGTYVIVPGLYTFVQFYDAISQSWRVVNSQPGTKQFYVNSDGSNWRLANLTGCVVAVQVTNKGSNYTSAPTVTASAGASAYQSIVGGAINTTVTITAGGTLFTYAPTLLVSAPPAGGFQATATCTISAGAINAVTVVNQGAGYASAPTITVVNDPRDTTGSGAVLTAALTGSGTITGIICTNPGAPLTAVPTLSFSGGAGSSAAAVVVGCYTITGYTADTAGAGYGTSLPFLPTAVPVGLTAGANTNPYYEAGVYVSRPGLIAGTSTAGGATTATGLVISDGGLFKKAPNALVMTDQIVGVSGGTNAAGSFAIGGVSDTSQVQAV